MHVIGARANCRCAHESYVHASIFCFICVHVPAGWINHVCIMHASAWRDWKKLVILHIHPQCPTVATTIRRWESRMAMPICSRPLCSGRRRRPLSMDGRRDVRNVARGTPAASPANSLIFNYFIVFRFSRLFLHNIVGHTKIISSSLFFGNVVLGRHLQQLAYK